MSFTAAGTCSIWFTDHTVNPSRITWAMANDMILLKIFPSFPIRNVREI